MMSNQTLPRLRRSLRAEQPLIHCITNHISIRICANAILALGGRPIMAEHPAEVAEITASAGALCLNLGNISDARMDAMLAAGVSAQQHKVPCVLDLVGVGCSALRLDFAHRLIREVHPVLLKGNASELRAVCGLAHHAKGIDANESDPIENIRAAQTAAQRFEASVLLSGAEDVVTDGAQTALIRNGVPRMADVTGTGCMQGMLAGAFLAVASPMESAVSAAVLMGLSGEYAEDVFQRTQSITQFGNGLIDGIYTLSDEVLTQQARVCWQ